MLLPSTSYSVNNIEPSSTTSIDVGPNTLPSITRTTHSRSCNAAVAVPLANDPLSNNEDSLLVRCNSATLPSSSAIEARSSLVRCNSAALPSSAGQKPGIDEGLMSISDGGSGSQCPLNKEMTLEIKRKAHLLSMNQREKALRGQVLGPSLFVGDLDREVTEQQLFEVFSQVGPVGSIRVCRDAVTRGSLGYAYVDYNGALDAEAATRALDALNFTPLNGKPIRIMWSHRIPSYRKSGLGNIFIKNLDKSIDNKALHDTFGTFGQILSCTIASDSAGASKGYGFVRFETEEAAKLAVTKVNGMMIKEKIVSVGPLQPCGDRPTAHDNLKNVLTLLVKNLPSEETDADFGKLVREFGEVSSAVIMKSDSGSKGFGFVNFKEPEAAAKCIEALRSREYKGKTLYVRLAQRKTERHAVTLA